MTTNSGKIIELQKLSGMDKFSKLSVADALQQANLLEVKNKNMVDLIAKARKEALARGIEANSVFINADMVEVSETWFRDEFGGVRSIPPMICGLHAYLTKDELPEGYSFAVLRGPEYEDRLEAFESIGMAPEELRKAADFYRRVKGEFEK